MRSDHWMLVDTSFTVYHSFYGAALRDPITAVLLAVRDVQRYARQHNPDRILFAFDSKPYHRSILYPEYKIKREKVKLDDEEQATLDELKSQSFKLRDSYLSKLGFSNVFYQQGYEADDIMAQIVQNAPAETRITIVSRDHDLFQLLSPRVSVFDPVTSTTHTNQSFRRQHSIHPTEWVDAKAIAGCSSDGIPGVVGVAIPTALKWLRGELSSGKRAKDIREFLRSADYQRNLKLVTLPYAGMQSIHPTGNDPRDTSEAWDRLVLDLERPGLVNQADYGITWSRS